MQRISAISSVKGETNVLFNEWRDRILKNIALLTTVIDFGEDHDIEEINELFQSVGNDVSKLDDEIRKYVSKIKRSQVLLEGIKLTLIGPPNAGKSSLLNILAQEDKAIVSSIAGTTRDAMEVPLDISGYKVIVGDTAGIRRSSDVIENEGIRRAKKKSLTSDINIVLLPADDDKIDPSFLSHASNVISDKKMLSYVIVNKVDLIDDATKQTLPERLSQKLKIPRDRIKLISCTTQCGIEELIQDLTNRFKEITSTEIADPVTISKRAREILINDILYGFSEFRKFKDADDIVMASEALRCSVDGIGKITGEAIGVEEILGVVFSKFCIGK
ncbi:tRNA modification GTPase MSS1, mitochondrial [Pichia kudriavzevii]|uniref:tRNA modification GTPase MSS1, mitochondrial n=1 Tax=Pichia kudriavzevii TaxID=4909 RepID=A0A1V2LLX2_PICKU|nr:tRNA modification GTPase MSS1, mitochondrial [Pichia kudriavzevii]